ncbi:hypothetical protein BH11MYX4_BH11MYX4_66660 [soil metagenome]
MPEANVLYSVTAAVVLGLITWVAVVLKTAKEPWARELPKAARVDDDVPLEAPASASVAASPENEMTSEGGPAPGAKAEAAEGAKADAAKEEKAAADVKADAEEKAEAVAEASADAKVEAKAEADAKA